MQWWAQLFVPLILSGGFLGAVGTLIVSRSRSKQLAAKADAIGIDAESQAEMVAMSTMRVALESAQAQNEVLTERLVRAEAALDSERDGRARDRAAHRAEVERLESRIAQLVGEVAQIQAEVSEYRRARFPD